MTLVIDRAIFDYENSAHRNRSLSLGIDRCRAQYFQPRLKCFASNRRFAIIHDNRLVSTSSRQATHQTQPILSSFSLKICVLCWLLPPGCQ